MIAVDYTGRANAKDAVYASISWFNSRGGFAFVELSAQDNPLIFVTNLICISAITTTNISGYTLR